MIRSGGRSVARSSMTDMRAPILARRAASSRTPNSELRTELRTPNSIHAWTTEDFSPQCPPLNRKDSSMSEQPQQVTQGPESQIEALVDEREMRTIYSNFFRMFTAS